MKHTFKTLLGLVLLVFVLAGCSSPVGPEVSEIDKTTVVETPEDNIKSVKVEFRWASCPYMPGSSLSKSRFGTHSPRYLLDLHRDSKVNNRYAYGYPESYPSDSYREFCKKDKFGNFSDEFKEFSDNVFEEIFGIRDCKEGEVIDLTQWTSRAIELAAYDYGFINTSRLYFLAEDVESYSEEINSKKSFDTIEVGNVDIVVYVCYESEDFESLDEIR